MVFEYWSFTKEGTKCVAHKKYLNCEEILDEMNHFCPTYVTHCIALEKEEQYLKSILDEAKKDPHCIVVSMDYSEKYALKSLVEIQAQHIGRKSLVLHGCLIYYLDQVFILYTGGDFEHKSPELTFEAWNYAVNFIESKFNTTINKSYRITDNAPADYRSGIVFQLSLCFSREMQIVVYELRHQPEHGKGPIDSANGSGFKLICDDYVFRHQKTISSFSEACQIVREHNQRHPQRTRKLFQEIKSSRAQSLYNNNKTIRDNNNDYKLAGISNYFYYEVDGVNIQKTDKKATIRCKKTISSNDATDPWTDVEVKLAKHLIRDEDKYVFRRNKYLDQFSSDL